MCEKFIGARSDCACSSSASRHWKPKRNGGVHASRCRRCSERAAAGGLQTGQKVLAATQPRCAQSASCAACPCNQFVTVANVLPARSMLPTPVTSGGSATPRTPSGAPGAKALPAKGGSLPSSTKLPGRPVARQPAVASPATSFGGTCGSSLSFAPITPLPAGSAGGTAEVAVEQEVEQVAQQLDTAVAKEPHAQEAASKSQTVQDVAALQDDFRAERQVRHLVLAHGSASAFNAITLNITLHAGGCLPAAASTYCRRGCSCPRAQGHCVAIKRGDVICPARIRASRSPERSHGTCVSAAVHDMLWHDGVHVLPAFGRGTALMLSRAVAQSQTSSAHAQPECCTDDTC